MKFKVGDKVRFLNEAGGGVVSRVISSNLVHVKIEDGFEIPTATSELVPDQRDTQDSSHLFMDEPVSVPDYSENENETGPEEEVVYDDRITPLEIFRAKAKNKKGVYLAFVPQDQRFLLTGLMDVFLINFTDYDLLFSMFLRKANGAWQGMDYDAVKPRSKVLLNTIKREEIEKWSYGIVQLMYHKDISSKVLTPANCTFSFKPAKLYRENSYIESAFLAEKAFLMFLNEIEVHPVAAESEIEEKKEEEEIKTQHAKQEKPEEVINKHKTGPREAVVDLHIGELIEDYSKMSSTEMLNYQLNYFVKCLEGAIRNYLTKVTFIHGVGDGVLKNKMYEILYTYENVKTKDASLKNFGYGATEVLIWHSNFV